ncbi:hypothetical protein B9Z19DRAFT_1123494 [Tuber borchii]|uniref:Uncharacterized protein n=1 Tax=Tuber borchii TaxID=42251 RepID=A0A2T6ZYC6_TUBBO|nr:hypothetical protein B9Z19DRAFT_1123494 [Tuber borchii]
MLNKQKTPFYRRIFSFNTEREAISDGVQSARSRSGKQQHQSSNSPSTLPKGQLSHFYHGPPNATGALERPAKPARRRTIQSTKYADIETEHDEQASTEIVRLSDNSIDKYQNCRGSDQTESDTEPDAEDNDIPEATGAGLRHRSQTVDGHINNRVLTARVSTTSGSQEAALVRRTPAALGCIMPGRAYTRPVLLSSSVARYLSPLATHCATTSRVRSSSPAGESSTPHHERIWPNTLSQRNTARGANVAVVSLAKALILWYTLFVDPLPVPVTLTSQVHRA